MRFQRDVCVDLDRSLRRAWLATDGRGGYASLTIAGAPTTRFHGLLVSAFDGNPHRHVFVSRVEESVVRDGRAIDLGVALYAGSVSPTGHQFLQEFVASPSPVTRWRAGDIVLEREVRTLRGRRGTLVRYTLTESDGPVTLRLRPFLPFRESEALTVENAVLDGSVEDIGHGVRIRPYAMLPALEMQLEPAEGARFEAAPAWYRGTTLPDDIAIGHAGCEDTFTPGAFEIDVAAGESVTLRLAIDATTRTPAAAWSAAAPEPLADDADVRTRLSHAAPNYLITAADGRAGVNAGYPWFGEWGRDAFISLPGLTLAGGDLAACAAVLTGADGWLRSGRLPNVWRETPEASCYRAIDPALWFVRAVALFADAGGSRRVLAKRLLPSVRRVVRGYLDAADEVVTRRPDGLLHTGAPAFAFTWMDCLPFRGGARFGTCVEINALWYMALARLARWEHRMGSRRAARRMSAEAERVGASFLAVFRRDDGFGLRDSVDGSGDGEFVRPNMVIAAALEDSPLSRAERRVVVDVARAELLTPRGLRTLSPRHAAYRGLYRGGEDARNAAYHMGTVWPWLLGFYVEARLRAEGRTPGVKRDLRALLDGFAPHLDEGCLGHVAEVFDGDPPHRPGGAFAQAWSVGELLRGYALLEARR